MPVVWKGRTLEVLDASRQGAYIKERLKLKYYTFIAMSPFPSRASKVKGWLSGVLLWVSLLCAGVAPLLRQEYHTQRSVEHVVGFFPISELTFFVYLKMSPTFTNTNF